MKTDKLLWFCAGVLTTLLLISVYSIGKARGITEVEATNAVLFED